MDRESESVPRAEAAWEGDWLKRLRQRVQEHGSDTITAFLTDHQGLTYAAVARALGTDVAPIQVQWAQFEEAQGSVERIRNAAADALVREASAHLKKGWGLGLHFPRQSAGIWADWKAAVLSRLEDADRVAIEGNLKNVWERLGTLPPPEGWKPLSSDDPVVTTAFNLAWPLRPSG